MFREMYSYAVAAAVIAAITMPTTSSRRLRLSPQSEGKKTDGSCLVASPSSCHPSPKRLGDLSPDRDCCTSSSAGSRSIATCPTASASIATQPRENRASSDALKANGGLDGMVEAIEAARLALSEAARLAVSEACEDDELLLVSVSF